MTCIKIDSFQQGVTDLVRDTSDFCDELTSGLESENEGVVEFVKKMEPTLKKTESPCGISYCDLRSGESFLGDSTIL